MTTADLRYPSAEDFLAELENFFDDVSEGKYFDEEAAIYFSEDNFNQTNVSAAALDCIRTRRNYLSPVDADPY